MCTHMPSALLCVFLYGNLCKFFGCVRAEKHCFDINETLRLLVEINCAVVYNENTIIVTMQLIVTRKII